jgi:hypothetical protein
MTTRYGDASLLGYVRERFLFYFYFVFRVDAQQTRLCRAKRFALSGWQSKLGSLEKKKILGIYERRTPGTVDRIFNQTEVGNGSSVLLK